MTTPSADTPDTAQRAARLDEVLARIDAAAARAGRDPSEVTLLLATKTRTPAQIAAAVAEGATIVRVGSAIFGARA